MNPISTSEYSLESVEPHLREEYSFAHWSEDNKHWVELYRNFGEQQSVMDAILTYTDSRFQNWKTVMENFYRLSKLSQIIAKYPICNGDSALTSWRHLTDQPNDTENIVCSVCFSIPSAIITGPFLYYIPLKYRIECIAQNELACEQLFGNRYESVDGMYNYF